MKPAYYIGIMSGTSLDGVDAVLADFSESSPQLLKSHFLPYDASMRSQLLALHQIGNDELHRAAMMSNTLSVLYANAVNDLLKMSGLVSKDVIAVGCHGQTIRHCPEVERSYTIQLVNAALLAELTAIAVVADFRSRDIAAGGQGAPLVPAFHQAIFMRPECSRVILNIGGISNITCLEPSKAVVGFDCGPGNLLMDAWCLRHTARSYDQDGEWASSGEMIPDLLEKLLAHPFFSLSAPKSTGRDLFNMTWLDQYLAGDEKPENVQATLLQLTVQTIADSILVHCPNAEEIYVCGGGAHNGLLMSRLSEALPEKSIGLTDQLGVDADWVEAYAFAWLAQQTIMGVPSNLPVVTGAKGDRVLGAIYPA
ncbi:MAG: anhydro-N-acetylmuramic acid kinase [Nitrosomonas sp.]|nr:anhydro-N-acetylmuramic acid kinase [Nitrosomonas sp.]